MYLTVEEATTYFEGKLNTSPWDDASEEDQGKALTQATRIIDNLNFVGEKADEDQTNQFPRGSDSTIPTGIQYACSEIALALLDGVDPEIEYENLSMISQGYSSVRSTYDRELIPENTVAGVPSVTAWRYLLPYLRGNKSITISRV